MPTVCRTDNYARGVWNGAEAMRQLAELAEWWFDNRDQWADSDRPRDRHPLWLLRAYEQEIQRWERERLSDEGVPPP
jgi:hypothetical protein